VSGVYVNNVRSPAGNRLEDVIDQGAMGVDNSKCVAGVEVGHDHVAHEGCLTSFPEDSAMLPAILFVD